MVNIQATLKRDGVQDFLTLRFTAIIISAFSLYMLWFFVSTPTIDYPTWKQFFSGVGTQVFTMAALVSIMMHVRIGLWQVLTDYVKAPKLRALLQFVLNLIAFAYVVVGIAVLWGGQ